MKLINIKIVIVSFVLFLVFIINCLEVSSGNNSLNIVYITDLNLYPTPSVSSEDPHPLERESGLLIYESQAIFQEIIRYINQRTDIDFVVFGGNNIFNDFWQLFFDIVSEIKNNVLFVSGNNEIKLFKSADFLRALSLYGVDSKNGWWSKSVDDYLLIGLNSLYLFSNDSNGANGAKAQIKWLKEVLKTEKDKTTIIFLHRPIVDSNGVFVKNKYIDNLLQIIRLNNQVKLVLSGSEYISRKHLIGATVYLHSPSPIAYPCSFKVIEILDYGFKVKSLIIPLKGIVKKAEKSLIDSLYARSMFLNNPKLVKKHVSGSASDNDFQISF